MASAAEELGARSTGAGVFIVRNPQSGRSVVRADPDDVIAARLPGAVVRELNEGERVDDVVAAALAAPSPPDVLGVLGGDGSVARMAQLARHHGMPLLVLPGGTFNHFARALGIESIAVALDAFAAGSRRTVSVAEVSADGGDPVTVLNAVSLGTYPRVVAEREDRMDHLGKWLGGVVAAWRALRDADPVVVARAGRRARVWSVFVSIGRSAPDQVATMQRTAVDEDVLDIRFHHARGSRARAVSSLVFGRKSAAFLRAVRLMPPESDIERIVAPELELQVRPADGVPSVWVHDGELEDGPSRAWMLRCVIVPDALDVYAPIPPG